MTISPFNLGWEFFAPVIGIAGIWLGSLLQKNRERAKDRQDQRLKAYATFLEIWAVTERPDFNIVMSRFLANADLSEQETQFLTFVKERLDHAHTNLVIYGSAKVISALSALYSNTDSHLTDNRKRLYTNLLLSMRSDSYAENYHKFNEDVDNIMLSGPLERRSKIFARSQSTEGEE